MGEMLEVWSLDSLQKMPDTPLVQYASQIVEDTNLVSAQGREKRDEASRANMDSVASAAVVSVAGAQAYLTASAPKARTDARNTRSTIILPIPSVIQLSRNCRGVEACVR